MTIDPPPIAEIDCPSVEQFQRDLYFQAQPVVLRGIGRDWPAVQAARQSPQVLAQWLKKMVGDRDVDIIQAKLGGDPTFFYDDDLLDVNFEPGRMAFHRFVERIMEQADENTKSLYLQATAATALSPALGGTFRLPYPPPSAKPNIWMGNATVTQTHFDLSQNIAVVVSGQRRFTLFPPEQVANLYMSPIESAPSGTPISMVRLDTADLEKHPRFAKAMAHAVAADLQPGDGIFIPYMWWHRVEATGPLNMLVNYWWNEYADFGSPMFAMLHAVVTMRDLPPAMRSAWKAMFDHFIFDGEIGGARSMDHLPPQARGGLGPVTPNMRADLWHAIAQGITPALRK